MNLNLDTTDFQRVSNINIPDIFYRRMKTGMSDLDEIFGNGILPGSSFTLTARAGCGKTTFLLQLCEALANNNYKVGYASGEENTFQLAFNCERLNVKNVEIANITNIEKLCEATKNFDVLVIDSFQSLTSEDDLNSKELERHAVTSLVTAGKINECAIFFIMHLTKAGVLKGGTLIPHTVDVNMEIVPDDDAGDDQARVISFKKNRFGSCGDYSAYMTSTGFAFNGKVDVTEKASPKEKRMEANIDKVLSMKEPPYITKKRVMNELDLTSSQAYVLLKEMTDRDVIKKFGRGDDAVYKVVNVVINDLVNA
jgi:predicted ATP-dependent serine protease